MHSPFRRPHACQQSATCWLSKCSSLRSNCKSRQGKRSSRKRVPSQATNHCIKLVSLSPRCNCSRASSLTVHSPFRRPHACQQSATCWLSKCSSLRSNCKSRQGKRSSRKRVPSQATNHCIKLVSLSPRCNCSRASSLTVHSPFRRPHACQQSATCWLSKCSSLRSNCKSRQGKRSSRKRI